MQCNKKKCLVEQVRRFRARFVQSVGAVLGDVIPGELLIQWITEEIGGYRERIYGPLATLVLFIEQVLGADHSCQKNEGSGLESSVLDVKPIENLVGVPSSYFNPSSSSFLRI